MLMFFYLAAPESNSVLSSLSINFLQVADRSQYPCRDYLRPFSFFCLHALLGGADSQREARTSNGVWAKNPARDILWEEACTRAERILSEI